MGKKIATCNYCGTRAVLVFDAARHELTCSACGAPLHDMKFMPQPADTKQKKALKPKPKPTPGRGAAAAGAMGLAGKAAWGIKDKKSGKKRKKKPIFRRVLEDIFDEIEDIFD